MIPLPLSLLSPLWLRWLKVGAWVAVALTCAAAGAYVNSLWWSKREAWWATRWAERDADDARQREENTRLVLTAEKNYLNQIATAERDRNAAQATIDTERRRADAAANSLRRAGADYLATINRADTTLSACRQRAATLWQLFDEADGAAGAMAQAAEQHAADLRKMMVAWPT